MLYPTHRKYGILWGLVAISVAVVVGLIPVISSDMRGFDLILVFTAVYMGMSGALFGSRFPDIDSASSIPARKHPIIRKIFVKFGVKHRGRYSHDYASIGLTFFLLYLLVVKGGERLLISVSDGSVLLNFVVYISCLIFIHMVSMDIIEMFQWFANKQKNKKLWSKLEDNSFKYSMVISVVLLIIMGILNIVDFKGIITFNISTESAIKILTLLLVSLKVYVVFAWVGAYSHLFADMTTKSGVNAFGKNIAPAKLILKLKKIPLIGNILVPTNFTTGSKWEDYNNMVVTVLCIPAFIFAVLMLIGFNPMEILRLFGWG